jgi:hypothetical protein
VIEGVMSTPTLLATANGSEVECIEVVVVIVVVVDDGRRGVDVVVDSFEYELT